MNSVRLWGDPFAATPAAARLRTFLLVCEEHGMRTALCLTAVPAPVPAGLPGVELHDGARALRVPCALPAAERQRALRAVGTVVPASAPVIVFAEATTLAEQAQTAGLEWPRACRVLAPAATDTAAELLARVRAELHWSGGQDPPFGCDAALLRPFLQLPPPAAGGVIVHPGSADPADGTDLALAACAALPDAASRCLRIVVDGGDDERAAVTAMARASAGAVAVQVVAGPLAAAHLRDAALVLMPLRDGHGLGRITLALASGRPLCLSRFQATAALVPAPGICEPLGGRWLPPENGRPRRFEPDRRALSSALQRLLADAAAGQALGARGRAFAEAELTAGAPGPARPRRSAATADRPSVVLEAPLFEVSSSSELTIETACALARRGNVELLLRPRAPFRGGVAMLRERAPELLPHLCRDVRAADLWLSAGWPPRADRPEAGCFALRFDYEYGTLPVELSPLLTQEADRVVVHSSHVFRTLTAAGRPAAELALLPHGVDGERFHEHAAALAGVVERKQNLPAVLFTGGLVWRKGFDVYLRILLHAAAAGARFVAVVKAVGGDQHYAGFSLEDLAHRFANTPGAPPLLLIDRELSRAEMAGLYRACDLLLHPYRGEGFGLPVLEARACGLPVLITANGSTEDFAAGPGVVRIPSARRPIELPTPHVSQPWVLEPDPEAAGQLLVQALDNLSRLQREARAAAHAVRSVFTWDAAAEGIERLACEAMARRAALRNSRSQGGMAPLPI